MSQHFDQLVKNAYNETWQEELARAKKYREATQKRTTEKQAHKEIEKLKKTSRVGRLKIEP